MSEVARALLLKLLSQADRGGRETIPISEHSASDYFSVTDLSGRDSIHSYLENAEKSNAILLDRGRGAESQDLIRIRLLDADKLAEWLEVPRACAYAELIEKELTPLLEDANDWLQEAFGYAMSSWTLGKMAFRISFKDTDAAVNLFKVALSVSNNEHRDLDMRTYSVRVLNDSKAIEGMLNKLALLLRRNPEWNQFDDNNELFRMLGLEKFPPPIYIKGPLFIKYCNEDWDISTLRPFVGISPDMVSDIKLTRNVPYVLTVENLASFQRHVREIDDDSIVIFSGGFPSPALTHILKLIDQCVPDGNRYLHWGDRDVGGIRIFSHIESNISRHTLIPHLMNEGAFVESVFNKNEIKHLTVYSAKESSAGNMAKYWLENKLGPIEQESQDPISPQ